MKNANVMEEPDLMRRMVGTLIDKFGPVETQRFVSLCGGKRMESVRRHQLWQKHLDKGAFAKSISAYTKNRLPK
ncbi:MAG: hypothetical protein WC299_02970 [Kiritimatiellia bacterium]